MKSPKCATGMRAAGTRLRRALLVWIGLSIPLGLAPVQAQDARGYRGRWNDWVYQEMALDHDVWRVTVEAVEKTNNNFKIASDDWVNQWTRNGNLPLAQMATAFTSGENTEISAVVGRHYTFAMNNANYGAPGQMIVQETANEPVSISSVSQVVDGSNATVTIGTSAEPGAGEKILVRYSLDDWNSSAFAAATGSGTNWTAAIEHAPGEVGLTCSYYVLTTTVPEPSHAHADLQTIRWNNNGEANFAYAVDGPAPAAPTTQAFDLQFADLTHDGATVSWTRGNGVGCIVLARAGAPVDADPQDGMSYSANAAFGDGAELGSGNFVVYSGPDSSAAVAKLPPATPCHFRAYEFNGGGTSIVYNVATAAGNPASVATPEAPPYPLYLNEVLSSKDSSEQDEDGDYSDWIELWNAGTQPVPLAGWGLSDNDASPFKWTFGDVTIQPGEFLVVWASSKNRPAVTNGNQLHTSFAISAGGEELLLTHPDGTRIDEFAPIAIPTDYSLGRQPDGTGPWKYFPVHTPGAANATAGYDAILAAPAFSVPGGIYATNVAVELATVETGAVIRYTLDGSEPTAGSPLFTNALALGSKAGTSNALSAIPTNFDPNPGPPYYEGWQPPAGEVFKFHVVRARVFRDGAMASPAVTQSYLVDAAGTNRFTLPVVSIATDADNLFADDIGIYTPVNGNMWQSGSAWERPGTLEFFEPGGALAFRGNIGVRLHGNTTRSRPRKALRIYARGAGPFEYPIFPDKAVDEFDTFILRNGGNDWGNGVIRDLFLQSLAENTGLDRQFGRPALVFLNGEYWGLHDLRERFDDGYAEHNYGLDELEYVQVEIDNASASPHVPIYDSGNPDLGGDFSNLWNYVRTHDLADPAHYAAVQDRLAVDSFIDFYQANIFFANTDWPGNNVRAWRSVATNRVEGAPARHDARWRFMLYDADFGFGADFIYVPGSSNYVFQPGERDFGYFAQHDTLAFAANANADEDYWSNHPDATLMFRQFLSNETFRQAFVVRFCDQLNTAYSCAHVTNRWAQWVAAVAPEMDEHAARWRQPTDWASECDRIRAYGEQRTDAVRGHVQNFFGLAAPVNLTLAVTNAAAGFVRLNALDIDVGTAGFAGYPWTGAYFTNYPVALAAQARPGFQFVEWRKDGAAYDTNAAIAVALAAAVRYEAVFKADPPPAVVAPIAFQQLVEGAAPAGFDLDAVFADPEGQPLEFAATSADTNVLDVALAGSALSATPRRRGETAVTVTASDGFSTATNAFRALVYPAAHDLAAGAFTFGEWDAAQPAGAYPDHMIFLQCVQKDPLVDTPLEYAYNIPLADASAPADADFPYAASSRTRINGLGTNGLAFINTGRDRDLGGALLALDTRSVSNAPVSWVGGTVLTNVRIYAIRLQYRVGATNAFTDVLDAEGQPVEYLRNAANGHAQTMDPVQLPADALGQEYVQLLWRYYLVSGTEKARAQLRLDNLQVANRLAGFSAWQQGAFTPAELADPAISGPLADPGQTGAPNLLRYALGIGRHDDCQAALPAGDVAEASRIYRHRRLLAADRGVSYEIATTDDLAGGSWIPADIGMDLLDLGAAPTGDGLTETIAYQVSEERLPSPRHLRLKVTADE
ncbi:MAG: hypothetical protein EOM72_03090 [Opitutae bacterium]|nr:hypothetical protein [Opitutae bacterium]